MASQLEGLRLGSGLGALLLLPGGGGWGGCKTSLKQKKKARFSGITAAPGAGAAGRVGCPAGGCVQYRPEDAGG